MPVYLIVLAVALAAFAAMFFSVLSYALRDYSKTRLADQLRRFNRIQALDVIVDKTADLIFVTATARLLANILVLICVLRLVHETHWSLGAEYFTSVVITGFITIIMSVAVPNAAAKYAGETAIAACSGLLRFIRVAMVPVTAVMHAVDDLIRRATGSGLTPPPEHIEEDLLQAIEEGEKEGVVDEAEREMIESVIEFRETTAGQIMTARPEIVGIEMPATLDDVKHALEESGHSRIPVYDGTLDHIAGILYARDLLRYVGQTIESFDLRPVLRPALYVPESKSVRDLLADFRLQKVHLAIVLDEYGGTAGLVSIEDILEELVGPIADEHEPSEPAMLKRVTDSVYEADARIYLDELNRLTGLSLPEDAGYDTLAGFVTTTLGRIPTVGTRFENNGNTFVVLDAEPQKVNRVRIELALQPAEGEAA